jgi:Fic family protein
MADLSNRYNQVDSLLHQLNELKPFKKEDEERLWKKFRLEWNYNSNHIEGNTLTYGQTELLLFFGKTTGDHDFREYQEMSAHDAAVKLIQEYANDSSRDLTEADVRELNKVILVRPYWGNAQTPDGQPTKKEIIPGEYKKQPNSVRLQNGEMFHYTSPEETPAKMAELMAWYSKAETEKELHPLYLAARIHYDFVRIHPFDDCNGRTSRLLMNYVLLRHGFPPVIIKSADKKNYLNALNKADVGDFEAFVEYVGEQLVWSLLLSIQAANGANIEEGDDVYKEIEILKKQSRSELSMVVPKSVTKIEEMLDSSIGFLFDLFCEKQALFNDFFLTNEVIVGFDGNNQVAKDTQAAKAYFKSALRHYESFNIVDRESSWFISYSHRNLKRIQNEEPYVNELIRIVFRPLKVEIFLNDKNVKSLNYSEELKDNDVETIVRETAKNVKMKIPG